MIFFSFAGSLGKLNATQSIEIPIFIFSSPIYLRPAPVVHVVSQRSFFYAFHDILIAAL